MSLIHFDSEYVIPGFEYIPPACDKCARILGEPFLHALGHPLVVPVGYGWVVSVGLLSIAVVTYFNLKMERARRDFQVPAPLIYSPDKMEFNCYYRPVTATMEIYPQFMFMLLVGGIELPYWSAVAGLIWVAGRIVYARQYWRLEWPVYGRRNGAPWIAGHFMLWVACCKFVMNKLVF